MKRISRLLLLISFLTLCFHSLFAQVGIGTPTPHASSRLEISSTNSGILIPRMTTAQRTGISTPAKGLMVFDNTTSSFWFHNGTGWTELSSGGISNYWSQNGSNVFNNNAGNIGIGTNNPSSLLALQTPLNTTGFTHTGGNNEIVVTEAIGGISGSIGTSTNHPFRINSNAVGMLHVYPGGEVVVGANTTGSFGRLTVETTNNSYGISHRSIEGNILSTRIGGTTAGIGTFSNTHMRLFCNGLSAMLIDAATGNIGIGTDAPAVRLHVNGNQVTDGWAEFTGSVGIGTAPTVAALHINRNNEAIRLTGNQSYMTFFNGADYKGYLWNKGNDDMELGTASVNANGRLFLSIKGTPYLTVNNDGRIAINGPFATFNPFNGNRAITVTNSIILKDYTNNFNEWGLSSNFEDLSFTINGLSRAWIDVNGDYNTFSDYRLKDEVLSYKTVLPGIKKLSIVTYHYRSNPGNSRSFGLIAQNVGEHFPEVINKTRGEKGEEFIGIAYGKTGVLALKAIQEQQEIIEKQQDKIQTLEKRIAQIEKLLAENFNQ